MPPVKPNKKPTTGVPGVKMLITAASLAATVGGWALISAKETTAVQPVQQSAAAQPVAPQVVAPVFSIKLAPLPTLVPAIASQAQIVTVSNQRAASAPRPAAAAPQAAPQPAAAQPGLVLRDVSAPAPSSGRPAPVANTGSSR
jgi:hypothetical protein